MKASKRLDLKRKWLSVASALRKHFLAWLCRLAGWALGGSIAPVGFGL
jgi:hypothetical protein